MSYSPWSHKESDTTEQACAHAHTHTHTHARTLLRICLPMKGQGFNPKSRKIPHTTGQLSPRATTTEAELSGPSSATRDASATRSPHTTREQASPAPQHKNDRNEKPTHHNQRLASACHNQRKPNVYQRRPSTDKNKYFFKRRPYYWHLS